MLQKVQNVSKKYFVVINYKQQYLFKYFLIFTIFILNDAISVEQCCVKEGIPNICVRTLCNPGSPPSDFAVYDVFDRRNNCSKYLNTIAKCLAAGRDHSSCCRKEAKDLEENACFGLCKGEGNFQRPSAYQTCIALNLASMFSCFEKGYQKIPSSPRNLIIGQISSMEAEFSWQEPEHNSKFVDHYLIYIYELETGKEKADLSTELQIETMAKEAKITQLEPGTRYLLQIIALGVTDTKLDLSRSLPSDLIFKTCGIAPQAKPFKEKIYSAISSNTLLACRIRTSGSSTKNGLIIKWEHKKHEIHRQGHFHSVELNEERIIQSHYVFSKLRPRELLAMLQIKRTRSEDYGHYKCRVIDDFGETEAIVHLAIASVQLPLASPPEMPRQCCARRGVSKRCLIMCGLSDSETRRYVPRPFMSLNCSGEIAKVLACAMPLVDESSCCMIKEVPSECLYLCDHQLKAPNLMPSHCLKFVSTAEECRLSGIHNRPSVVKNFKAQIITTKEGSSTTSSSININFDNSERADIYYIYWRSEGGNWQHKSSTGIIKKLILNSKVDELVVVAANSFGFSQPSQLFLREGKWAKL